MHKDGGMVQWGCEKAEEAKVSEAVLMNCAENCFLSEVFSEEEK